MNATARARTAAPERTDKAALRGSAAAQDKNAAQRQTLIRLIHVARRELGLDEPTYRTMLRTAGQADSTTAMSVPQLKAVVEHAKRCGFKVRAKPAKPAKADRRQDTSPEARKVRALWLFLHHLGAVRDPSERALSTYVKRIAKVDDMHWAHGYRMLALIETLKKWAMRYLPAAVQALSMELKAHAQAHALTPEQAAAADKAWARLGSGVGFDVHWDAWECLHVALGRPLPAELSSIRSR